MTSQTEFQHNIIPMDIIAEFSKVPLDEFITTFKNINGYEKLTEMEEAVVTKIWEKIELPKRSTDGSAGYDIRTPYGFTLNLGDNILIPTGIRCEFDKNYGMFILPRSGLGTKKRLMMANTVPLIDSDYSFADNTGHIMLKLCYDGIKPSIQVKADIETNDDGKINLKTNWLGVYSEPIIYDREFKAEQNDRIVQAVFVKIGFAAETEEELAKRTDGLGSTGN